jgi:hypothetical protein
LLAISRVQVSGNNDGAAPVDEGTNVDEGGGGTVTSIQGPPDRTTAGSGISAGAAVGIAIAAVAVALAILFVARRRKRANEHQALLDKRVLTEDEEDVFTNAENPRLVHVVGEDDSIWTGGENIEVRPYMRKSLNDTQETQDSSEQYEIHDENHWCASPNCLTCEKKRQEGVRFMQTDAVSSPQAVPRDASRSYTTRDTVDL